MVESTYIAINVNAHFMHLTKNSFFFLSRFTVYLLSEDYNIKFYIYLWFAWEIVPLWYQQQPFTSMTIPSISCDLLEKLYLCGINNNTTYTITIACIVVICLKNCTFVVSTTTRFNVHCSASSLWFAWKIVPLWYQQQRLKYRFYCN